MVRTLVALAVLCMARLAMGQMVVGDDEKVMQMKHNPSYDNLYRPGNAIWRLRMLRMGMVPSINDTNADLNTSIDMGSTESAPVVSEPLRINNTKDVMSMPSDQQRDMEELIKEDAETMLDILNGLAKQTPPVVHGDIKPANIVIGAKDRRAHLIGFGGALADMNNQPKHTPASAGTAGYAPLEQLQGNADSRSDLYGLAATMHHLLTNRNPRNNPPFVYPLASMLNPQLSLEVERVLVRGLSNDITQRYQSASEMKRDIDDILQRRYGITGDISNFALGFSGPMGAVQPANTSTSAKTTTNIREWFHLPGAASANSQPGSVASVSQPGPPLSQGRSYKMSNILIVVLLFLLIMGGLSLPGPTLEGPSPEAKQTLGEE